MHPEFPFRRHQACRSCLLRGMEEVIKVKFKGALNESGHEYLPATKTPEDKIYAPETR